MMHNPPHPGDVIKHDVLEPLSLSVAEAARRLGVSRTALSRVLNRETAIRPNLALRLEKAGVSTARSWLAMQADYELWQAMQHAQPTVRPLGVAVSTSSVVSH